MCYSALFSLKVEAYCYSNNIWGMIREKQYYNQELKEEEPLMQNFHPNCTNIFCINIKLSVVFLQLKGSTLADWSQQSNQPTLLRCMSLLHLQSTINGYGLLNFKNKDYV